MEQFKVIFKNIPGKKIGNNDANKNQSFQHISGVLLNEIQNSRQKPQIQEEVYRFLVDENFAKQKILKILDSSNLSQQFSKQGQPSSEIQFQQQGQFYGNQFQNQPLTPNNPYGQPQYQQENLNQQNYRGQNTVEGNYSDGAQNNQQNIYSQHPNSNQIYSNMNNNQYQRPDSMAEPTRINDEIFGNEYEGQMGGGAQKNGYRKDSYFNSNEDYVNVNEDIGTSANNNDILGGGVGQRQNDYYQNMDQQYLTADPFMGEGENYKQEENYDAYQNNQRPGYSNQVDPYNQQISSAAPSQPSQLHPKQLQNVQQNQGFPPNKQIQNQPIQQTQIPPSQLGVQQNITQNIYQPQQKPNINKRQPTTGQDQFNYNQQQKGSIVQTNNQPNPYNQQNTNQLLGQQQSFDQQYHQQIQQQQPQQQQQAPLKNNQQLNSSIQQSTPLNQQLIQKQLSNLPQQQLQPSQQQRTSQQTGNLSLSQQQSSSLHNSLVGNRPQPHQQVNQQQQQQILKSQNQDIETKNNYRTLNPTQEPIQSQLNNPQNSQTSSLYPQLQQQNINGLQAYQSLNESNHSLGKGTNSNQGSQHRSNANKKNFPLNQPHGTLPQVSQVPYPQNQNQQPQMINQNLQLNSSQYNQQQNAKLNINANTQQNLNIQASIPGQTLQQPQIPPQQILQHQQHKIGGGLNSSTDKTSRGISQEESLKGSYHQQNPKQYTQNQQQSGQGVKVVTGMNNQKSSHDLKSSQQQQGPQIVQNQTQYQPSNIHLQQQNLKPVDASINYKQGQAIIQQQTGMNQGIPHQHVKQEIQTLNQLNSQPYPTQLNGQDLGQGVPQQIDSQTIPTAQSISKVNQVKNAQQQKLLQQSGQNINQLNQNQIAPNQTQQKQSQQSQLQQKRNPSLNSSIQGNLTNPQDQNQQQQQFQQGMLGQNISNINGQPQTNPQGVLSQVNTSISQGIPSNGKPAAQGTNNKQSAAQQQPQQVGIQPQQIGIQPQQLQLQQNQQIQQKQQQQQQGGIGGAAGYPQNIQIQNKSYNIKNNGKQVLAWDDYHYFLSNPYYIDDENKSYDVLQITKSENNSPRTSNMNDSSSTITEQQHSSFFPSSKHQPLNASITQTQEYPSTVQTTQQQPSSQIHYQKNINNQYQADPNIQIQQNPHQKGGNQNQPYPNLQYQYSQNEQIIPSNQTGNPSQAVHPQTSQYPQSTVQQGNQVLDYSQTKMEESSYNQNSQHGQQQWMNQQQVRNPQIQGKQVPIQNTLVNPNYQHQQQQNQMMKQQSNVGYQPQNQIAQMSNIENDLLNNSQFNLSFENNKANEGMQQYPKNELISGHNIEQQFQMSHINNGSYSQQYQMNRNMNNNQYSQDANMQDDYMGQQSQDPNNEQMLKGRMQSSQQHMQNMQNIQQSQQGMPIDPNFKKSGTELSSGAQVVKWTPNPQGLNYDDDLNLIKEVFSKNTKYDAEMQRQITSDVQKFKQNNQNLTIRAIKMPNEKEPTFKLEIKDKKRKDFQELFLNVIPRKDQPYEIDQCKNHKNLTQHKIPKTNSLMDIIKFWWKFEFQTIEEEKKQNTGNQPNIQNNGQPPPNNGMMPPQMYHNSGHY